MKSEEIEGWWFVFGSQHPPLFGVVRFDPDEGITLNAKIPPALSSLQHFNLKIASPVVYGSDEQQRPITLFTLTQRHRSLTTIDLDVMRVLIGTHKAAWEEAVFTSATIEYSLLHQWTGEFGMTATSAGVAVTKTSDSSTECLLPEGRMMISHHYSIKHDFDRGEVRAGRSILFGFSTGKPVDSILYDYVFLVQKLLTLFCGQKVNLESVKFQEVDAEGRTQEVKLLARFPGRSENATNTTIRSFVLVPYQTIKTEFPNIVARWFKYYRQVESTLMLYFATIFCRDLYIDHEFLFLAQAIEVYHDSNSGFSNCVEPKQQFLAKRSSILASVPESEREWLEEKLHYANKKTLAQRILEVLQAHPDEVSRLIEDRDSFAKIVRDTRNFYTHFDEDLRRKGRVAQGAVLGRTTSRLKALLEICILKDLGIHGPPINEIIERCLRVKYLD